VRRLLQLPRTPESTIPRGNNRQVIFAADEDFQFFREALVEAAANNGLAIHAFVWMTNHVHLLATPQQENT
jgi:putative transposase